MARILSFKKPLFPGSSRFVFVTPTNVLFSQAPTTGEIIAFEKFSMPTKKA